MGVFGRAEVSASISAASLGVRQLTAFRRNHPHVPFADKQLFFRTGDMCNRPFYSHRPPAWAKVSAGRKSVYPQVGLAGKAGGGSRKTTTTNLRVYGWLCALKYIQDVPLPAVGSANRPIQLALRRARAVSEGLRETGKLVSHLGRIRFE